MKKAFGTLESVSVKAVKRLQAMRIAKIGAKPTADVTTGSQSTGLGKELRARLGLGPESGARKGLRAMGSSFPCHSSAGSIVLNPLIRGGVVRLNYLKTLGGSSVFLCISIYTVVIVLISRSQRAQKLPWDTWQGVMRGRLGMRASEDTILETDKKM